MPRIAHGDLILEETIGAGTDPTITEVTALISNGYREVYTIMYPTVLAAYTATDTKDTDEIVVNDHVFGLLLPWFSQVVNDYFQSGANMDGTYRLTNIAMPKKLKEELRKWKNKYLMVAKLRINNIPLWGSTIRDFHRVRR